MAVLLAGLPTSVPAGTINRLCGSGLDAVGTAARAIKTGEAALVIAGGVESMTRAPFAMGKATEAFSRQTEVYDTTIGWRFVNPLLKAQYGIESMPERGKTSRRNPGLARTIRTRSRCQPDSGPSRRKSRVSRFARSRRW